MLIAGLGNIGKQYEGTRHNLGFIVADAFLEHMEKNMVRVEQISGNKFKGELYRCTFDKTNKPMMSDNPIYVVKPQTFMNISGECIQPLMAWYNIKAENLLVLHDELDIPFSHIRFKTGGGLAGHNGLKSIAQRLSTQDFHRLRLGIGRPENKEQMINWVLSSFPPQERTELPHVLENAVQAILCFLNEGSKICIQKYK